MAITVRLSEEAESKLRTLSEREGKTKSQIIKESLNLYFEKYAAEKTPFEIGQDLFGKYKSGFSDRSVNSKKEAKKRIKAKFRETMSD